MKSQTLLPSRLWICLLLPMVLNTIFTYLFFPLGKMIGMVRSRASFILSSQSWEIDSPPTGSAGRIKLSCVGPHRSYSSDPFIYLE